LTGNHWVAVPCIHPADGSVHAMGVVHRGLRGAVEFAGAIGFVEGGGAPLLQLGLRINDTPVDLSTSRMAWQRVSEWIPTFNAVVDTVTVRGTIFAPFGKGTELPGFVYVVSFENVGDAPVTIDINPRGTLGVRQHRVTSARLLDDAHVAVAVGDHVILTGASPLPGTALAISMSGAEARVVPHTASVEWSLASHLVAEPKSRVEVAIYVAAGLERDGALATLAAMRDRGWRMLAESTRAALNGLQQSTGVAAADRLTNRHLMFAYFYSVARGIDDAQLYLVRSRAPWHSDGLTVRDWDALMWSIPAVQLADPDMARELILRMCEVHGYAPGRGVNYLDGAPFHAGFSIDGAAAYAIAVDRYIAQTGDDRIVEEPALADALYAANDDITARRHATHALYTTDVTPSGRAADLPYTLHSNAVVAEALDILRQTLDEKTAEKIEKGDVVRAAIVRQFAMEADNPRSYLATQIDLNGMSSSVDDPVGSAYWLPVYETLSRDDSTYRRTVRRLQDRIAPFHVATECAQLVGPEGAVALDRLRRVTMDNGVAAEYVDERGDAVGNGGDASLSGLVAYTVWYAVHALGVRL